MKTILILGNGRTMYNTPFYNYNIDTIGINIAFRFWHHINWYPTYYLSLDQDVNLFYHSDIYKLIINAKQYGIKGFLLRKVFLTIYPNLKSYPNVKFLEDIINGKGFNGDQQVTSGSFAVRWAIHLNYTQIYLLGIDCNYLPVKGVSLDKNQCLTTDIIPNPNYFFDGYQMKGDRFHISKKKGNKRQISHLDTFKKINKQFNKSNGPINVYNCSKQSMLYQKRILPFRTIPESLIKDIIEIDWDQVSQSILNDPSLRKKSVNIKRSGRSSKGPGPRPKIVKLRKGRTLRTIKNIVRSKKK